MAESKFIRHVPCPECKSSDAGGLYEDGSSKCHKCGHRWDDSGAGEEPRGSALIKDPTGLVPFQITGIPARKISHTTCRKFGYGFNAEKGCHVANYCDETGTVVAQKLRFENKSMPWTGDPGSAGLYGEWLWRAGGKMVIVTEGEIDALSVSQAQGNRYPVVSIPHGSNDAAAAITKSLRWLESFERVVFMFDEDEPGRKAAKECARLLTPGKAYLANLPLKDANELLKAGRQTEILQCAWDAKVWAPTEIVTGTGLADLLEAGAERAIMRWPYPALDQKTGGVRQGNIVLLVAGIGAGKTTLCRALVNSALDQGLRVGVVPLEETVRQFGVGLLGSRVGRNIVIEEDVSGLPEELRTELAKIQDRLIFMNDTGDRRDEAIFDSVRYMRLGLNCDMVLIDHLTMILGAASEADDRRHAERFILALEALTKRTGVIAIVVLHLRKPGDGKAHEEGRRITMSDIRGSGLVPASAHQIIAYERDQQNDARVGRLRVLKARPYGRTGPADSLSFDEESGILSVSDADGMLVPSVDDLGGGKF